MKKTLYAASAAITALMFSPAAHAAVIDGIDLSAVTNDSFSASSVVGSQDFPIILPLSGAYKASVAAAVTSGVSFQFTDVLLDGISIAPTILGGGKFTMGSFGISGAGHILTFVGTGSGSFGGSIAITAVPEPASWALMIAGIAGVGIAMRRRAQKVRFSFN